MSQVFFASEYEGRPVQVMGGWDRPIGNFFLTIFAVLDDEDEEEEVIWSALRYPSDLDFHNTQRLEAQLKKMGIEAPDGFWERLHRKEGNVIHDFSDGKWTSLSR